MFGLHINDDGKLSPWFCETNPFERWITVICSDDSYGYEWDAFNGFYDPATDAYYWHSDSGCSCSSWGDSLDNPDDFESSKNKEDMQRAFDRYRRDAYEDVPVSTAIRDFRKPTK